MRFEQKVTVKPVCGPALRKLGESAPEGGRGKSEVLRRKSGWWSQSRGVLLLCCPVS